MNVQELAPLAGAIFEEGATYTARWSEYQLSELVSERILNNIQYSSTCSHADHATAHVPVNIIIFTEPTSPDITTNVPAVRQCEGLLIVEKVGKFISSPISLSTLSLAWPYRGTWCKQVNTT
jgi:hypothetical protein